MFDWRKGFRLMPELRFEFLGRTSPTITIAIPTYRRPEMLLEAIASAITQLNVGEIEIIVLDNDEESRVDELILRSFPEIKRISFRYYVNIPSLSMCENWNMCAALSRAKYFTMLHDDDLLDTGFSSTMMAVLRDNPSIDGLICGKRYRDERKGSRPSGALTNAIRGGFRALVRSRKLDYLPVKRFFARNVAGNPVGFVCKVDDLMAAGGFKESDHPAYDYGLYVRFAENFNLFRLNTTLATIRRIDNYSISRDVQIGMLKNGLHIQKALAGRLVPQFFKFLSPWIVANQLAYFNKTWGGGISVESAAKELNVKIRMRGRTLVRAILLCLRA